MTKHDNEDKPTDWVVLVLGAAFILGGIGAPYLLWAYGGIDVAEWGFDSWQTYVSIICFVVYYTVGNLVIDMRKDDGT